MGRKPGKTKQSSKDGGVDSILGKLDTMDETTKIAVLGVGCLVLLLMLYCLYRICCGGSSNIEEDAEYIRRVKRASSHRSSRETRKSDTPGTGSTSRESKESRSRTPAPSSEGRRSPARTPARQPMEERDRRLNERTTQEDQPTAEFEAALERGHHRRLDKATRRLKRLLRLTKEEKKVGPGPSDDMQANILDAMGSVENVGAGPIGQSTPGAPVGSAQPGYEPAMPFMPETQKTEDAPKW